MNGCNAPDYIPSREALEFAIFCIENVAAYLQKDAQAVYQALISSGLLQTYIVPNFDILHTQDKNYIIDDILETMKERGVTI